VNTRSLLSFHPLHHNTFSRTDLLTRNGVREEREQTDPWFLSRLRHLQIVAGGRCKICICSLVRIIRSTN